MAEHYKSWSALKKRLEGLLCDALKGRIEYFLTYYRKVHNAYGRAAIKLDGTELACFSWIEMCRQEWAEADAYKQASSLPYDEVRQALKPQWDADGTYCNNDFINAALEFLNLPIEDALSSENCLIQIFAILDRRTGKRTLLRIKESEAVQSYPEWVRQFYQLRFEAENLYLSQNNQ